MNLFEWDLERLPPLTVEKWKVKSETLFLPSLMLHLIRQILPSLWSPWIFIYRKLGRACFGQTATKQEEDKHKLSLTSCQNELEMLMG